MLLHCLCRFKLLRLFSDSLPIGTHDQFGCRQSIGVVGQAQASPACGPVDPERRQRGEPVMAP